MKRTTEYIELCKHLKSIGWEECGQYQRQVDGIYRNVFKKYIKSVDEYFFTMIPQSTNLEDYERLIIESLDTAMDKIY